MKLDTFEKLELVVVLQTARRAISVRELAAELQVGHDVLRRLADDLARSALVEVAADDTVRLVAGADELEVIAEGAELYAADRSKVIALLSSIARNRILGMAGPSGGGLRLRKKPDPEDGGG
jgi:hypothetical protein